MDGKILVVDDEPDNIELLDRALVDFDVFAFQGGNPALSEFSPLPSAQGSF